MNTYNIHNAQGAWLCTVTAKTEVGALRKARKNWSGNDLKASKVG